MKFAALYVRPDGPYPAMTDHWFDADRDARTYQGLLPVVAHPPCKRWGRWWYADGSKRPGMDGGLFAHAIGEVRRCGGVLEHPEASHAFKRYDLAPPKLGAWSRCLMEGEWTTCVVQGAYGHKARKLTWLFYSGRCPPPSMNWTIPDKEFSYLLPPGRHPGRDPRTDIDRLSAAENELTPYEFAEALAGLALMSGRLN